MMIIFQKGDELDRIIEEAKRMNQDEFHSFGIQRGDIPAEGKAKGTEQNLFYQQLEKGGLVKKNGPIIIKTDRLLTQKERLSLQKEFEEAGSSIILLPAGFDIAETPAKWIDKEDPNYSGGGYSQCQNCGARFAWGAYHEPQEFRHCPTCGRRMEVEE